MVPYRASISPGMVRHYTISACVEGQLGCYQIPYGCDLKKSDFAERNRFLRKSLRAKSRSLWTRKEKSHRRSDFGKVKNRREKGRKFGHEARFFRAPYTALQAP